MESIIDALKEDERIRGMRTAPDAATEAFHASGRWTGQVARAGRGRGRGAAAEWCTHCNTESHSLEDCWSKGRKRSRITTGVTGGTTDAQDMLRWHCGYAGHRQGDCPVKRQGDEAWDGGRKKQTVEGADAQIGEREAGGGQ